MDKSVKGTDRKESPNCIRRRIAGKEQVHFLCQPG